MPKLKNSNETFWGISNHVSMECIQSIERIEPCQKQERKPTWIIQRISRNFCRQNEWNIISLNSTTPQHESVVLANGFGLCKATILHSWQVTQQEFPEVICNTSFVSLPQFLGYFNDPAINNNIVINGFIDH